MDTPAELTWIKYNMFKHLTKQHEVEPIIAIG